MTMTGVIGCSVLMNELAYLVRRDPEMHRVIVVDTPEGRKTAEVLERTSARESMWLVDGDDISVPISCTNQLTCWINPSDLHDSQERMREVLSDEITALAPIVDGFLMIYGQCRCQKLDVRDLQAEVGLPLVFLRDDHEAIVDDCICASLGSSERYLNAMNMHKGAIFVTPGYIDGYLNVRYSADIVQMMDDVEQLRAIMDFVGRPMIQKLETPLGSGEDYDRKINSFATIFVMDVLALSCGLEVFEHSYDRAKSLSRDHAMERARAEEQAMVLS